MEKRKKFDWNTPGAKEMWDEIVHGAFVTEGTMVAFPACFPSVTLPVPADESFFTSVAVNDDGIVYAGTGGRAVHLLVGMFHGVTGMVFDMGTVEGAVEAAAVCCGKKRFFAAVNGADGGQIILRDFQPLPFDLIQEWHIARSSYEYLPSPAAGEKIIHAVSSMDRQKVIGITESSLFVFDFETSSVEIEGAVPGKGRMGVGQDGLIFGPDTDSSLWCFDPGKTRLIRNNIPLPDDFSEPGVFIWCRDPVSGQLYTADGKGRLFSLSGNGISYAAEIPYAPVTSMAVTFDGRVFGSAGEEMSRLFCYNPRTGIVTDIGVAVSTLQRRRYGYSFADAVTGRDGEIIFGENDDLGHLWLYFPKIEK